MKKICVFLRIKTYYQLSSFPQYPGWPGWVNGFQCKQFCLSKHPQECGRTYSICSLNLIISTTAQFQRMLWIAAVLMVCIFQECLLFTNQKLKSIWNQQELIFFLFRKRQCWKRYRICNECCRFRFSLNYWKIQQPEVNYQTSLSFTHRTR